MSVHHPYADPRLANLVERVIELNQDPTDVARERAVTDEAGRLEALLGLPPLDPDRKGDITVKARVARLEVLLYTRHFLPPDLTAAHATLEHLAQTEKGCRFWTMKRGQVVNNVCKAPLPQFWLDRLCNGAELKIDPAPIQQPGAMANGRVIRSPRGL